MFTRGFILVTLAALGHSVSNGLISSTIALLVAQGLGLSAELIGFTIALSAVAAVSARAPLGSLIDRFGTRAFAIAGPAFVVLAAVIFALAGPGQIGTPFAPDLPLLVPIASLVWGLGISTFSTASATYLANTIPAARRAEGMGYYGLGMTAGQGLGAGAGYSIVSSSGFPLLYTAAGAACLFACVLIFFIHEAPRTTRSPGGIRLGFEPRVLAPTIAFFTLTMAIGFGLTLVPLMGSLRGLANPAVFFIASAIASAVGRLAGRLADRSRMMAIVPGMLLAGGAQLIVMQALTTEQVILAGVASGLGMAIAQPALQALAIDLVPPERRGVGVATFTAAADLGVLIGTSTAGVVFAHYSFEGAFGVAAAGPVLGLLALLALHQRTSRHLVATAEAARS
jgi:MFS family permease